MKKRLVKPLRLTPYAWAKLLRLRDLGPTEVGGFGISAEDDLLLVEDIQLVGQTCTAMSVQFHDSSVADYFDRQVDQGLAPERFARIWMHTHPGECPHPSSTDEATFARCFGSSDWSVMFILAKDGSTYARLQFRAGPGGQIELPVDIDFERPFPASAPEAWDAEYKQAVQAEAPWPRSRAKQEPFYDDPWAGYDPRLDGLFEARDDELIHDLFLESLDVRCF